jgi:hypothetical protein
MEESMGKGKLRHNPDKPQNKKGGFCQYFEETGCEGGYGDTKKCIGNPHNCVKTKYHRLAIAPNKNGR